ncbi:MAG: hypothetical protein ACYC96_03860 [Fimbriimonadaceae bacterium]
MVAAVIMLPSLSLGLAARAAAATQLTSNRLWAVMPFVDDHGGKLGGVAADRFSDELLKRQGEFRPPVETASSDSVNRTLVTLGLTPPVTDETSFLRVGQEMHAESLIRGEVLNSRVQGVPGGKQAEVIVRVEVVNVASGLPVNGAAISAVSTVRTGMSDDEMLNEAFTEAASVAVGKILNQTLPSATVLNTYVDTALINQGTRSGFADGQTVIVQRGREQVATGRIKDVEPDSSTVQVVNFTKGVAPGDKVTVVFKVPDILPTFGATPGSVNVKRSTRVGSQSGLISLLLLVALGVFLLGKGGATNQSSLNAVVAEPTLYPEGSGLVQNSSGGAAVRISWGTDLTGGGNSARLANQIYRNDFPASAVQVAFTGNQAYDTTVARDTSYQWYNFNHIYSSVGVAQSGVLGCTTLPLSAPVITPVPGVTPGRSYSYSVSLVFQMSSFNLPIAVTSAGGTGTTAGGTGTTAGGTGTTASGTTSTGTGTTTGGTTGLTGGTTGTGTGTTATGTTATGTTATGTGTTSGGNTTGATECDFEEAPVPAQGLATPLNPTSVTSPADQTTITAPTPFTFNSAVNPAFPSQFQYVLQFSTTPTFAKGPNTFTFAPFITGATGPVSTPSVDTTSTILPTAIRSALLVYWRIGARSTLDSPGPVMDISGERYIFSVPRQFKRLSAPPPAPVKALRTVVTPNVRTKRK